MKRFLSLLMAVIILFSLAPYKLVDAATIKLNKTKATIYECEGIALKITGTRKAVKWTSSKKSVATVADDGFVTGKSPGTATITAAVNNKKYTCKVTVKKGFNEEDALKNLKTTEIPWEDGLLVEVENNYTFPYFLSATIVFYDSTGTVVDGYESYPQDAGFYSSVSHLQVNEKNILNFSLPKDKDHNKLTYDSYKISYQFTKVSPHKNSVKVSDDYITTDEYGNDIVKIGVTSSEDKLIGAFDFNIVFYKDERILKVAFNSYYELMQEAESDASFYTYILPFEGTRYVSTFILPRDEMGNIIFPDYYNIYISWNYTYLPPEW